VIFSRINPLIVIGFLTRSISFYIQVLLNLIPTWDGGKARVWLSHTPEDITPLKRDNNGNIVPFFTEHEQVQTQIISLF
jgi:hypothetical protein